MTRTETTDPSKRYEQLFTDEQEALAGAADAEARGWSHMARKYRNRARGYKAARTSLARREGWN